MIATGKQMPLFRLPPAGVHHGLTLEQFNVLSYLLLMAGSPATLFPSKPDVRVLRLLIRLGYVEVIGLSPARYRVTELGRAARSTFIAAAR